MRVGIDLGTTYCAIAYVDKETGKTNVIKNPYGLTTTPSALYFEKNGNVIHGQEAKDYYEDGDPDTEAYFKYKMGDPYFETDHYGKTYKAEDLSALLLKGIIRDAEKEVGEKIDEAIITVPAYFEDPNRKATIRAGEKAGLKVLGLINEPTAAVFAYGLNEKESNKMVMIFDLGGGTFDITIARVTEKDITVLGSDGDHELGGRDWDDVIVKYLMDCFYDEFDIMLGDDLEFNNTLRVTAEKTKKALATKQAEKVTINYKGHKGIYTITADKFAEISEALVARTENIIERLFSELRFTWSDIDGVILVGGSTKMKMVRDFVERMCGRKPYSGVDPDLAVATGAAIRANIDENGNTIQKKTFFLSGKREQPTFRIAGAKSFHEATSHSMGMITESSDREKYINSIMIRKNSPVPSEYTETYMLRVRNNNDNELDIYMLQGEIEELDYPLNATCLGKYVFRGIEYKGNKEEEIEVTYSYSEDSRVSVSAVQKSVGKNLKLTIVPVEEDMSWVLSSPKDNVTTQVVNMDIAFAIDLSGSMSGALVKVKESAKAFVDQFDLSHTNVSLVAFAERLQKVQKLSNDKRTLYHAIDSLNISDKLGYGTSAIPFDMCMDTMKNKDNIRYILVLTDGVWSDPKLAISQAQTLRKKGIEIVAIGLGSGVNLDFLKKIASREEFAELTELSGLTETFTGIARKM